MGSAEKTVRSTLGPSSCMIPDCYTYIDDPQLLSWQQLFKMLIQTQELLDQDIPIIGLVKGANRKQITYCFEQLLEIGLTTFVFPARELAQAELLEPFISNLAYTILKKKVNVNLIIYGLSYPIHRIPLREMSYASISWYIDAKYAYYYWNRLRYLEGENGTIAHIMAA